MKTAKTAAVICFWMLLLLLLLLLSMPAAGSPPARFEMPVPKTKIGDSYGHPSYAPGYHNIAVSGDEVYVAYTNKNVSNEIEVCVGLSSNKGVIWNRSIVVAHHKDIDSTGAALAIGINPLDPKNIILHLAWGVKNPKTLDGDIFYARSINRGLSWSTPVNVSGTIPSIDFTRSISADSFGGVHIAYAGTQGIYYNSSGNGGADFNKLPTLILSAKGVSEPSLISYGNGNVFVAAIGSAIHFVSKTSGAWSKPVKVNGHYPPGWPSIASLDSKKVYIAWGLGDEGICLAKSSDGGLSWDQKRVIGQGGSETSLVVDATGILNLAWSSPEGVRFSRSEGNDSSWTAPVLIDPDGVMPNMALSTTGQAFIMDSTKITPENAVYFIGEQP